ncbi:MAG: hypothetical protein DMG07_10235 [Acidobacteria bacterium]|nr:MAG: hypothetical protein DMG07_10235 [Acidobacteriota bacterium]
MAVQDGGFGMVREPVSGAVRGSEKVAAVEGCAIQGTRALCGSKVHAAERRPSPRWTANPQVRIGRERTAVLDSMLSRQTGDETVGHRGLRTSAARRICSMAPETL